jgi:hypothetical protein
MGIDAIAHPINAIMTGGQDVTYDNGIDVLDAFNNE